MAIPQVQEKNWLEKINEWIDHKVIEQPGIAITTIVALSALSLIAAMVLVAGTGGNLLAIAGGVILGLATSVATAIFFAKICIENTPSLKGPEPLGSDKKA